jgi:small subunit ribosomal protein S19
VHTGNNFVTLKVTNDMLGHKFGEFASTRRYGVKKKKKGKKG